MRVLFLIERRLILVFTFVQVLTLSHAHSLIRFLVHTFFHSLHALVVLTHSVHAPSQICTPFLSPLVYPSLAPTGGYLPRSTKRSLFLVLIPSIFVPRIYEPNRAVSSVQRRRSDSRVNVGGRRTDVGVNKQRGSLG